MKLREFTEEGNQKFILLYQKIKASVQQKKSIEKGYTSNFQKQMEDLVNIVLPSLAKLGESNSKMPVGMLLASLVAENLVSKDKFIDVQNNLKEMKKLGDLLQFDIKLSSTLNALVP